MDNEVKTKDEKDNDAIEALLGCFYILIGVLIVRFIINNFILSDIEPLSFWTVFWIMVIVHIFS